MYVQTQRPYVHTRGIDMRTRVCTPRLYICAHVDMCTQYIQARTHTRSMVLLPVEMTSVLLRARVSSRITPSWTSALEASPTHPVSMRSGTRRGSADGTAVLKRKRVGMCRAPQNGGSTPGVLQGSPTADLGGPAHPVCARQHDRRTLPPRLMDLSNTLFHALCF